MHDRSVSWCIDALYQCFLVAYIMDMNTSYNSNFFPSLFYICCYTHPFLKKKAIGILCMPPFICLSIHPSVCLSDFLLINQWAEFNQTTYYMIFFSVHPFGELLLNTGWNLTKFATLLPLVARMCESNIIFPSLWCPSICLSHYLLLTTGWNLTRLATWLPLMVRMCESNIIFLSVCPSNIHRSVHVSFTLSPNLNHCAEINQSCYMTSPTW